jgi:hypothetical protein
VPIVSALSGRPPEPKAVHRSAPPGLLLLAGGAGCLLFSGGWSANSGPSALLLLAGLVGTVTGMFLLAPLCVAVLAAAAGPRVPVAVRIALRDLVRYRARSGAALAAVSFAVFLAILISIIASVRFSNVLDYTGQNLTPDQLIVYAQQHGPNSGESAGLSEDQVRALQQKVSSFAATLDPRYVLTLDTAGATLQQQGRGNNNFSGTLYVATPQLLATYGIRQVDPAADILSMRPGLDAEPRMQLLYGDLGNPKANPSTADNPKIETAAGLPSGTSAPNTVITEHAIQRYHLHAVPAGWLIETARPLTAAQISAARHIAASAGVSVETKSGELGLGQISDGATALGLVIALGVLVMSVGLVRSETTGELRTLTAAGASSRVRRTITAATAGAIGLLGAVLGAAVATLAGVAWARSSLSTTFGDVPALDLLLILAGLPVAAAVGGWLLAGRQPPAISRQPLESARKPGPFGTVKRRLLAQAGTGVGGLALALQDLGRAADHAAHRVVDQDRADARRGLDPAGQAGQQRAAAGQPDLAADHVLGQPGRDLRQHLVHRARDGRDDRLERVRDQEAGHVLGARRPVRQVQADRLGEALGPAGDAERRLQLPGRALADDQAELVPQRLHDGLVHGVARLAQRLGPDHPPAGHGRDLGGAAADVDHEAARPAGQVEPGAGRGGHRLVDQPDVVPGPPDGQRGDDRPPLDRRGPARHAYQRVPPGQREPAGPAQERVQHGRGRVQVRDDPVPQRVDHLDVLRLLVGQHLRRLAHRGDLAHAGVDGDRGRLLEHDAPAGHPDERVHGAEIDRHATPEAHPASLRASHRST